MIRIVHLTDFHLNSPNLNDWNNYVKEPLLNQLKNYNSEHKIDFIAFTGDMLDKGGKDFKNIQEAFEIFKESVINPILAELDMDINRFFIIPGNHDIIRSKDSERDELGSVEYFKNYKNVSHFMENAIKTDDFSGMKRIQDYKVFEKKLYESVDKNAFLWTVFGTSFKIKSKGQSIGICCLNSSWRCYQNEDKGKLLIGEPQLIRISNFIKDCNIKIALIHHPLDVLADTEKNIISDHIFKDYDVLLLGHSHETITSFQTAMSGSLFINLAPSGVNDIRSDNRTFSNGFSIIDFDKIGRKVDCHHLRYSHKIKDFVPNTEAGMNGSGTASFIIANATNERKSELLSHIIAKIKEERYNEMDEHLIDAKVNASKKPLKTGFILPPIVEGGAKSSNENDKYQEEHISISQIVRTKSSQLFLGGQESGKTILLYRLIVEYVEEYELHRKVPVFIDCNEIGNKEIKTCIKDYLRCSSSDVDFLLSSNHIVLLLDNLKYEKKQQNIHQINRIHKFAHDFESIQIIATSDCDFVNIIPDEKVKQCKIPFRNFFIKNLRAKEIKKLMAIWVPNENDDAIKVDSRLDKLIQNFDSYALPSTAMSVSLFLWSTEYSDRKPINSAVLFEIYIEIILEKLNKENIYRSSFDFTNKLQLLAKIAYEIHSAQTVDNTIKYSDFVKTIENYLENEVGFGYDSQMIVNYFLARKIFLKNHDNRIKFSSSCLLHFFLAKRMQFDSDFKKFVFSENEYYKYIREIDFYTGLTRSDKEVLEVMLERFNKTFIPLNYILEIKNLDAYFTPKNNKGEPVTKDIEINKIIENRPSEEILEDFHNRRLEKIEDPTTIIEINSGLTLDKLLILMSNILRNSEGIEDLNMKKQAYNSLVKGCMIYMVLKKESIIVHVLKHKKLPPFIPSEINLIHYLTNLPLYVQGGMSKYLGTPKLSTVIIDKINADKKNKDITDIESFLSVGLYSDIQGNDFNLQLKSFISRLSTDKEKNVAMNYCLDKLTDYYYRRTRNGSANEEMYLNLLADLKIRSLNKSKRYKESIKKSLKEAKKKFQQLI